ncbi:MAG: hypothetical protein HY716_01005 [Planctomycetes bacterium]|nr:hypothetical protein [Planctomycetota bacterium]
MSGYEVEYVTLNDPVTRHGFWIRRTRQGSESYLWFFLFGNERLALREPCKQGGSPLRGSLGKAEWNLALNSSVPHRPIPAMLRPFIGARVESVSLDGRFYGVIRAAGRHYDLKGAPGCMTRVLGKGYHRPWAWVHCNFFEEEGIVFEALASGRLASIWARHGQITWPFHSIVSVWRSAMSWGPGPRGWTLSRTGWTRRLVAEVTCRPEDLVGVEYVGPRGERAYCYNTEVASMRLVLRRRAVPGSPWQTEVAESRGTTHYEFSSLRKREDLPLSLSF